MVLVLLHLDGDGRLADTACWRRCHASIKSRQASPIGDERQNKSRSDRRSGRQPQRESARRRSGPSPARRTSPTTRITTASLNATADAESRAAPAALSRFVQLDSERRFDRAAAERWFRREAAVLTSAPARRRGCCAKRPKW